jgi:hypothetical protein
MRNFAGTYWYEGRFKTVRAHSDGEEVAVRLLRSLADDLAARGVRLLVVAQAGRDLSSDEIALAARVLKSLARSPAVVLDLHGPLAEVREQDPARFGQFYGRHMTGAGNAFVADRIAEVLRRAAGSGSAAWRSSGQRQGSRAMRRAAQSV